MTLNEGTNYNNEKEIDSDNNNYCNSNNSCNSKATYIPLQVNGIMVSLTAQEMLIPKEKMVYQSIMES